MFKFEVVFYACLLICAVSLVLMFKTNPKQWMPLVVLIVLSLLLAILTAQFAHLDEIILKLVKGSG